MKIFPLTKRLKQLDLVKPSSAWLQQNRELLLVKINKNAPAGVSARQEIKEFGFNWDSVTALASWLFPARQTIRLLKPTSALLSLTIFILAGGIFSVSAAQETVPGDALYTLKIASEKVQQALTVDETKQVQLEINLAGKRIDELEKIVSDQHADPTGDSQLADEKVVVVIDKFEENLISAKSKLTEININDSSATAALLASEINNKTSQYEDVLDETAKGIISIEVKKKVQDAASSAEASSAEALNIMVVRHANGETAILTDELTEKINGKITKLNDKLEAVTTEIAGLLAATSTVQLLSGGTEEGVATTTTVSLLIAKDQVDVATKVLGEAQDLTQGQGSSLVNALEKINETKTLVEVVKERVSTLATNVLNNAEVIDNKVIDDVTGAIQATSSAQLLPAIDSSTVNNLTKDITVKTLVK